MRVAIIDLGTNSVRFDINMIGANGSSTLLYREKLMIRLGQGVFVQGKLNSGAIGRTVQAFSRFRQLAQSMRVTRVVAFGTSALREAQNSHVLIERVKEKTGIEIRIISGKEEAKLIALGVLSHEPSPRGNFALIDIGGGSTEISICRGKRILRTESFPLGTARLQQLFLKRSPPYQESVTQLRNYIRNLLGQKLKVERWPRAKIAIGSSGTVKSAAKLLGHKNKIFTRAQLSGLVEELTEMTTTELLNIRGMEPKRVDMILAGLILLEESCRLLGVGRVRPTEYSLRDGLLEEERNLARSPQKSALELHLGDLYNRAVSFGGNQLHLERQAELARDFFRRLRSLHRLDPKWEIYFVSGVILKDCGAIVNLGDKGKHSYYIVKNSGFSSMESWEHEFVALLCRYHAEGKVSPKELTALGKDKQRAVAFKKLLPLLRVIDCLDLGLGTRVRWRKIQISLQSVVATVGGLHTAGIEQLMLEQKKKLFEETFRHQLVLKRLKRG